MNTVVSVVLWTVYLISLYFAIFWFLIFLNGGELAPKKKKIAKYPFITIAIPAYNEAKNIKSTIESIMNLDYPKNLFELIVVDDGSKDDTYEVAKETLDSYLGFNTKLITKENGGKGTAMNIALKQARGEYFICLDGDSTIEPSAVRKMLPYFSERRVAAVLPCMKVGNPKNLLQKVQWYEYVINMYYKKLMSHLNCVHVAPGPFSMYKLSVIKKLGGFAINNLTEDLEITYRLQKNNYRIIQLLDVYVHTNVPDTLKKLYLQRNRWFKGSLLNSMDYRRMIFNSKFGDFGLMQLPMVLISGVLSVILVSTSLYYMVQPKLITLKNLYFVNFDVFVFFRNMNFNYYFIDSDFSLLLLFIVTFSIAIVTLYLAHKYTKEKIFKFGFTPLFTYMFFYYLYFGVVWCGIFYDLMRGKVQKW